MKSRSDLSAVKHRCAGNLSIRNVFILTLTLLLGFSAAGFAQMGSGSNSELQQKLMALKQSAAQNKQRLHQYQWVETQQITLKGGAGYATLNGTDTYHISFRARWVSGTSRTDLRLQISAFRTLLRIGRSGKEQEPCCEAKAGRRSDPKDVMHQSLAA